MIEAGRRDGTSVWTVRRSTNQARFGFEDSQGYESFIEYVIEADRLGFRPASAAVAE